MHTTHKCCLQNEQLLPAHLLGLMPVPCKTMDMRAMVHVVCATSHIELSRRRLGVAACRQVLPATDSQSGMPLCTQPALFTFCSTP